MRVVVSVSSRWGCLDPAICSPGQELEPTMSAKNRGTLGRGSWRGAGGSWGEAGGELGESWRERHSRADSSHASQPHSRAVGNHNITSAQVTQHIDIGDTALGYQTPSPLPSET